MPHFEYDKDFPFAAFITNLGKYNEGELVGEWVKFPTTADELKKVVGKTVVTVDEQDHGSTSWASSRARITALALFRHSSYSVSGTESATMPAPLRTKTRPFFW